MATINISRACLGLTAVLAVTLAGCASHSLPGPLQSLGSLGAQPGTPEATDGELKNPRKLHLAYARWQEQLGNLGEARASYEYVLDETPQSIDAVLGLARLDLLAGRTYEAEQGFARALRMKPNDPQVLDAAGQFYVAQKRWDKAVELLNAAMMAAPGESTYRYHLAVALARAGRTKESMPHFVKTVGDAEAHYNLGYILYEQDRLDAAEKHFLQALIKKPDLQQAQAMLDELERDRGNRTLLAGASSSGNGGNGSPVYHADRTEQNDGAWVPSTAGPAAGIPRSELTPQQIEQLKNQSAAD